MITDKHRWHYITIKSISGLFRGIKSNNHGDFYCLNCFHSYRTEDKLKTHELVCNDHHHGKINLPTEDNKILMNSQRRYSLKMAHAIYVDIECLLVKHLTCSNNTNKSFLQTISTHVPSGYSISVLNEFKANCCTYCRGEESMETLAKILLEIGKEISSKTKHDMIPLTDDENNQYENSEKCHICNKSFNTNKKSKYYHKFKKVHDHCHSTGKCRGAAHSLCS